MYFSKNNNIKTFIIVIIAYIILIFLTIFWLSFYPNREKYELSAKIIEINDEIIVFEDSNGNLWNYDFIKCNENVILLMDNNGTDKIFDDKIIAINNEYN